MGKLTNTVKGSIASFRSADKAPIESLKFHFLPKQATGTPSPENPIPIEGWTGLNGKRSGRNLLNPFTNPIWVGWGTFYTINSDGSVTVSSSDWRAWAGNDISPFLLPKGIYTFSWEGAEWIQIATSNDSYGNAALYYYSSTGGHVTFTLNDDGGVKFKLFGDYPLTCTVQIEPGLIAHDYVPYSEKSPIEQIPITFPSNGKNIVDWPTPNGFSVSASLFNGWNDDWIREPIYVDRSNFGKRIIYSAIIDNTNGIRDAALHVWVKDKNNVYVSSGITSEIVPVGSSKRVYAIVQISFTSWYKIYLGLTIGSGCIVSNPMAEYSTSMTNYEPYSSDNTFYGGYIDPVAGEIVAEYVKKVFNGSESAWGAIGDDWNTDNTGFCIRVSELTHIIDSNNIIKANLLRRSLYYNITYGQFYVAKDSWANFRLRMTESMTLQEFKTFLSQNNLEIVYPIATPIHIPIHASDQKLL